jgi:hypothetical protein
MVCCWGMGVVAFSISPPEYAEIPYQFLHETEKGAFI